jgi:hypothetical protein
MIYLRVPLGNGVQRRFQLCSVTLADRADSQARTRNAVKQFALTGGALPGARALVAGHVNSLVVIVGNVKVHGFLLVGITIIAEVRGFHKPS